ncbi:MAG: excisionase family DNA-binding protein [Planctomycetes bacterium]|nr:excisionase family DNA-binding protein [Planctomycetota bacterium]
MTRSAKENPGSAELLRVLRQIEAHLAAIRHAALAPARQWLTVDEVAKELCLSRDTVERLIAAGKLPAAHVTTRAGRGTRRRYRVRRDWIDTFLTDSVRSLQKPAREHRRPPALRTNVDFIG